MKADQHGTWTEQAMFKMGYLTREERQAAGIIGKSCISCKFFNTAGSFSSPKCASGNFTTRADSICNLYEAKP